MRLIRLYVDLPLAEGARLTLPSDAARHARQVLRVRPGAALVLFNGTGGEHAAGVEVADPSGVIVEVGAFRAIERESPVRIHLGQGLARGERMDYAVQKAVELGVSRISPLLTERSVVKLAGERSARRLAHWRSVAVHACEQCGRNRVPEIRPPMELGAWLNGVRENLRLVLAPGAPATLSSVALDGDAVALLVGPEGGLTPRETDTSIALGFTAVALGARTLRTETAAVVALAGIQLRFGDLA